MSKSRKKRKAKSSLATMPPLTLLRPRLDALLSDPTLADQDAQALADALDAVCTGLKPADFLPVLLRAHQAAPAAVQTRLNDVVPPWLAAHEAIDDLHTLAQRHNLTPQSQACALAWLEAAGADLATVQAIQQQTPFFGAYRYTDDSQGLLNILWYTDRRQHRVQGMGFLIDFNPPWEGAVKDLITGRPCAPEQALQRFVHFWADRGMPLQRISEAAAKKELLEYLAINRSEGIRLPRDLIINRRLFIDHILTLPDTPDTPPFTVEDFDALCHTGKTAESIRLYEERVGRRVRMEDGKELLIMGGAFDEDDWFDEDDEDDAWFDEDDEDDE